MDSPDRPHRSRHGSSNPVPVAALLARCDARPAEIRPGLEAEVVSVARLLRREGRGPHAADGRLRPRRHDGPVAEPARSTSRHSFRKASAAAVALFAIGAVFGPAIIHETSLVTRADADASTGGGIGADTAARRAAATAPPALATPGTRILAALFPSATDVRDEPALASAASIVRLPGTAAAGQPGAPGPGIPAAGGGIAPGPGGERKVGVATSPAAVTTPDITVSDTAVGPAKVGPAAVTVPDVAVSGGELSVSPESGVSATLPDVSASKTELRTPDLQVGEAAIPLPDVSLPAVELPVGSIVDGLLGGRPTPTAL